MTLSAYTNHEILGKLADVRGKITQHVNSLLLFLEPFSEDHLKHVPDMSTYLQNIRDGSLLLKQETTSLLGEEALKNIETGDLSAYLTKIRHDLRNRINAIQGYAEITLEDLQKIPVDGLENKIHEVISKVWQILNLIDEIRVTQLQLSPDSFGTTKKEIKEMMLSEGGDTTLSEFHQFKEGISILIVDDIEENCHILDQYLRRIGYKNIQVAHNGSQALEMIKKDGFDLVLLDVDMPGMNGIEVLLNIKGDMIHRQILVIMVSGADTMENTIKCIKLGAEDFLSKPFNRDLLSVRIGSCVEKKWFNNKETQYRQQLEIEKQRYERLLNAIFPPTIVSELTATNEVKARFYQNVAVLFTDVVNFTKYCDTHELPEIVHNIQDLSEMCEAVAIKHKLQKIKTIGDGFLATAGMLTENKNAVLDCLKCAEELLAQSVRLPAKWQIRAGIAFGIVIGGIVGHRQYLFDIWGDTVNTAARIQAYTEPNTIVLTKPAWEQVQTLCHSRSLGQITLKGKEPIEVFQYEKN